MRRRPTSVRSLVSQRGVAARFTVIFAAGASLHLAAAMPDGAGAARRADRWTGEVTFSADLEHTFNGSDEHRAPHALVASYYERARFKLTGGRVGPYSRAQMSGGGTGTAIFLDDSASNCMRSSNPWSEWSATRPALVAISYAAGRISVIPRIQVETVTSVLTGCNQPDETAVRTTSVPVFYLGIVGSIASQKVRPGDSVIVGGERFPIEMTAAGVTELAGQATLSWRLRRAPS